MKDQEPQAEAAQQQSADGPGTPPVVPRGTQSLPTGKRAALRDLRRELSDNELSNSGVQKLLLEMLENADDECERLRTLADAFYSADKKCAVLTEKVRTHKAIDVFFGAGVGLGGGIIGLAPFFWDTGQGHGWMALLLGALLVSGATVGRLVKG